MGKVGTLLNRMPGTAKEYSVLFFVLIGIMTAYSWSEMNTASWVVLGVISIPPLAVLLFDIE